MSTTVGMRKDQARMHKELNDPDFENLRVLDLLAQERAIRYRYARCVQAGIDALNLTPTQRRIYTDAYATEWEKSS